MKNTLALLFLVLQVGCAGSLREQSRTVSDGAADVINAGTHTMLSLYCSDSMHAIGRTGTLGSDGHCHESGPRSGSVATEEEQAALVTTRAQWAPVMAASEVVVHGHDALRGLIEATGSVSDGQILTALGELAASYEALRQAAIAARITPPPALSLGGAQ